MRLTRGEAVILHSMSGILLLYILVCLIMNLLAPVTLEQLGSTPVLTYGAAAFFGVGGLSSVSVHYWQATGSHQFRRLWSIGWLYAGAGVMIGLNIWEPQLLYRNMPTLVFAIMLCLLGASILFTLMNWLDARSREQ